MKLFKKILVFSLTLFALILPSIIFKTDTEFYNSLEGAFLPSYIFIIVWTIIDVLVSIMFTRLFFNRKNYKSSDIRRVFVFLTLLYICYCSFSYFFFVEKSLFLGYIFTILNLLFVVLSFLEILLIDKKASYYLIPYILWGIVATVLSIIIYLKN